MIIAFLISQLATFLLAISMPKHFRQVFKHHKQTKAIKITLVIVGWSMITIAITTLVMQQSITLALTEYFAVLTLNIIITALALDKYSRKSQ